MEERRTGALPCTIPKPPVALTMAGDDIHVNHRTPQLLEHLDHRALAGGNAPCQAHQEHLPGRLPTEKPNNHRSRARSAAWDGPGGNASRTCVLEESRPDQCRDRDAKEGKGDTAWPGSQS